MAFTEMRVGDQTIRHDRAKTQRAYSGLGKGAADECGCVYCQNFAAQRESAYPASFRRLLDQLGVDAAKEGHVFEVGTVEGGKVRYDGWFYLSGEMIEAGARNVNSDGVEYFFAAGIGRPPAALRGEPFLALEFVTTLDWILGNDPE